MLGKNITGEKIKSIRESKGITQDQLAARINIYGFEFDQTIVSKIENQVRQVTDYEVKLIANALGVKVEDLFDKYIK